MKVLSAGAGMLSATLMTGVVLAPPAHATQPKQSGANSAFAISASGLLKISPKPSVNDEQGFSEESVARLTLPQHLLDLKLLNARAGAGEARASVTDVSVGLGPGKPVVTASAVEAKCGHGKHVSSLAHAMIGDHRLDVQVPPNTAIAVPGASVTVNKQVTHEDGSVTVTALAVDIAGLQTLELASVTCRPHEPGGPDDPHGPGDGGGTSTSNSSGTSSASNTSAPSSSTSPNSGGASPAGDKPTADGKAPTPIPVKAHLDVTG